MGVGTVVKNSTDALTFFAIRNVSRETLASDRCETI